MSLAKQVKLRDAVQRLLDIPEEREPRVPGYKKWSKEQRETLFGLFRTDGYDKVMRDAIVQYSAKHKLNAEKVDFSMMNDPSLCEFASIFLLEIKTSKC